MRAERILLVNALMSVMKLCNLKSKVDDKETCSHTHTHTHGPDKAAFVDYWRPSLSLLTECKKHTASRVCVYICVTSLSALTLSPT